MGRKELSVEWLQPNRNIIVRSVFFFGSL